MTTTTVRLGAAARQLGVTSAELFRLIEEGHLTLYKRDGLPHVELDEARQAVLEHPATTDQ